MAPALRALYAAVLGALLAASVSPGCASDRAATAGDQPPRGSAPAVQEAARKSYVEGMEELVAGNFTRAIQLFNRVARSPRYVRYAALARLRIGDALFLQERHEEAIEAYRTFVAQHASDPNLPYARFRIAASYHARVPSDWFAAPPAWEKDQSMTIQAERELRGFVRTFPTSRWAPRARKMLEDARRMLLNRELYVARYYAEREEWRGAAWRWERALKEYPEMATTPDRIWRMARAYAKAGEVADAARAYAAYLEEFPEGSRSGDARKALESIRAELEESAP
ncbi:MAG: outer membrane protein assembly factor BamD [Myxococcota bacterium]